MNYDNIAHKYDCLYDGANFQEEDKAIGILIGNIKGIVCDLGCGTGQGIEILGAESGEYIGIDPSEKMLIRAQERFPKHQFIRGKIGDYPETERAKIVTGFFGVMNYLTNDEIKTALQVGEDIFLMDYVDGYHPVNYDASQNPRRKFSPESFGQLYKGTLFGNYRVYSTKDIKF